jgi:hypothetical protein
MIVRILVSLAVLPVVIVGVSAAVTGKSINSLLMENIHMCAGAILVILAFSWTLAFMEGRK